MAIPANQIINAEVVMSLVAGAQGSNAKNVQNVYHFRRTTTVNAPSKAALEAVFQTKVAAKVMLALNVRAVQNFTTVRWLNDPLDQAVAFVEAGVGAIAGDSMGIQNQAYMLFQTGIKGKSYRGNKKFGPLSESDSTLGTTDELNAGALALWATVAANLLTGLTDANGNVWMPQVYSRTLDALVVKPAVAASDVTTIKMRKTISRIARRAVKSVY